MATTIQVSTSTKQILDKIKEQEAAASYDEVITHLVRQHAKVPKSMFGAAPRKLKFTKKDKLILHEL